MPRYSVISPGKSYKLHTDPRSLALYDRLAAYGVLAVMGERKNRLGTLTAELFAREHPDPDEPLGYWLEVQFQEAAVVATDRRGWLPAKPDGDKD